MIGNVSLNSLLTPGTDDGQNLEPPTTPNWQEQFPDDLLPSTCEEFFSNMNIIQNFSISQINLTGLGGLENFMKSIGHYEYYIEMKDNCTESSTEFVSRFQINEIRL